MGLCERCAGKLERDLIRDRDWDYAASAFGLSADDREKLRRQVVEQYGEARELIAPIKQARKKRPLGKARGAECNRICLSQFPALQSDFAQFLFQSTQAAILLSDARDESLPGLIFSQTLI